MERLSERFMYYCGLLATKAPVDDLKHIQNLIDAEEQGLLLRLPCKVGTTVYVIEEEWEEIYEPDSRYYIICEHKFELDMFEDISKYVFLTREEAEKALEDMKGKV